MMTINILKNHHNMIGIIELILMNGNNSEKNSVSLPENEAVEKG